MNKKRILEKWLDELYNEIAKDITNKVKDHRVGEGDRKTKHFSYSVILVEINHI